MNKQVFNICRIVFAAVLLVPILVLEYVVHGKWAEITVIVLSAVAFAAVGYDVIIKSFLRIIHGQFLEESFLMTVASACAFAIGEYPEAVAVMLFFQIGETFEKSAVKKSRKSITALLQINPDKATVIIDGEDKESECKDVHVGDHIRVKPGERVPLDGYVIEGTSELDMSSLNGESTPKSVRSGDEVLSGSVNLSGVLVVEVSKEYGESTASRMIELVEKAREQKAPVENFITTFAKFYTPIVVGIALIIGIILPLSIHYNDWSTWSFWMKKAMVFLVVSCPCALVISVPLSYFGAIGLASRIGILIKGGHVFAAITKLDTIALDKTGTITEGRFTVRDVTPHENREYILQVAELCERQSNHPIARSICAATESSTRLGFECEVKEIRGKGMVATSESRTYYVGNSALMAMFGIECNEEKQAATVVYVADDNRMIGKIVIDDAIKEDSYIAIQKMREQNLRTVMLSGDNHLIAERIAKEVGVDEFVAEMLPEQKVEKVSGMMQAGSTVAFVGDGINDAPVIATADVGIAMGGIGSDAAIESADVVLMKDALTQIPKLKRISQKTQRIVIENISFALGVKVGVMAVSFTSIAQSAVMMWLAVCADVGVAVLAILNAMRAGLMKERY